jgi:hypothetical protein
MSSTDFPCCDSLDCAYRAPTEAFCTLSTSTVILCQILRPCGHALKSRWRFPCITALVLCRPAAEWAPDRLHQGFWNVASAGATIKAHTVSGHIGASPAESDDYGMGLCEAETEVDQVQWTMNSCKFSVYCGVTASEKPMGHSSIILMNSTWLPSVCTSHLITSSSGYGLDNLTHPDRPPLHSLQHGQAETLQICKFDFYLVLNSILVLFFLIIFLQEVMENGIIHSLSV